MLVGWGQVEINQAQMVMQTIIIMMEKARNAAEMKSIENDKLMQKKRELEAKKRAEQQEQAMRVFNRREEAATMIQKLVGKVKYYRYGKPIVSMLSPIVVEGMEQGLLKSFHICCFFLTTMTHVIHFPLTHD